MYKQRGRATIQQPQCAQHNLSCRNAAAAALSPSEPRQGRAYSSGSSQTARESASTSCSQLTMTAAIASPLLMPMRICRRRLVRVSKLAVKCSMSSASSAMRRAASSGLQRSGAPPTHLLEQQHGASAA